MDLSDALVIVFNLTLGKEDRIAVFSYQLRFNISFFLFHSFKGDTGTLSTSFGVRLAL